MSDVLDINPSCRYVGSDQITELPSFKSIHDLKALLPEVIKNLCRKYMNEPIDIEIEASGITTATIEHALIEVRQAAKFSLLSDIITVENPDSCIIV